METVNGTTAVLEVSVIHDDATPMVYRCFDCDMDGYTTTEPSISGSNLTWAYGHTVNYTGGATLYDNLDTVDVDDFPMFEVDPAYQLRYSILGTVLLTVAYMLVFIVGLLGNISVVIVVKKSSMVRSPTNRFIVNLAYADLLVNFLCLPFTLIGNLYPAWILGILFCKGVSYLQGVSVSASVNTLMAISIERCVAISFPISGTITTRQYRAIVTIIWFIALGINLPWLFVFTLRPIGIPGSIAQICTELWPTPESESWYFLFANLFFCYLGPLIVISICYVIIWKNVAYRSLPHEMQISHKAEVFNRSKVKVIKMVLVVIITFAISWLPLYVIFCIVKFSGDMLFDEKVQTVILNILPVAQWLGAANSCINPIVYAFMNRKFRTGFRHLFHSCCNGEEDDWDLPTTVARIEEKELYLRRVRSLNGKQRHQHTVIHYGKEHCAAVRIPMPTSTLVNAKN